MSILTIDTVIFDLFGTLVPNLDPEALAQAMGRMASSLGVTADAFEREWRKGFTARMVGTVVDGDEQFAPLLESLGHTTDAEHLAQATAIRREFMLEALTPKSDALDCLQQLVAAGYRLALSTDCSTETPELLDRTELGTFFPVRACSALLGVQKPHPRMYETILEALPVTGERCLFVGDGNSEELIGARAHGMVTVWVDNGDRQHWRERFVPDGDHTISELGELPGLVAGLNEGS